MTGLTTSRKPRRLLQGLRPVSSSRTLRLVALVTVVIGLLVSSWSAATPVAIAQPRLKDIKNSFAQQEILYLAQKRIATGYSDGTWRPTRIIRRAEFASMLDKAFPLATQQRARGSAATSPSRVTDISSNWARRSIERVISSGLMDAPGGRFRPDASLTRQDLVVALGKALQVCTGNEAWVNDWPTPFTDLTPRSPAFRPAEVTRRLGILPQTFADTFGAQQAVTRQEAAAAVAAALHLRTYVGTVVQAASDGSLLSIQESNGATRSLSVSPQATMVRNGSENDLSALRAGDEVRVLVGVDGQARAIRATGILQQQDLVNRVSAMTGQVLTPTAINALLKGDASTRSQALNSAVYDALLQQGLTPAEADALVTRDWNSVRGLAAQRLATALGQALNVSPDLVSAALSGNTTQLLASARLEALSRLLTQQLPSLLR
ncbi:MAG: S-layer homology domain-containing protein [Limnochordaceae bacterium]|nr:S-layer homology domain-containing protein [Limnochordaceae bacterium]